MSQRLPLKVAVVGAGWAGLSAAIRLIAAGANVSLFEAGRHAGGRARRVNLNGHAVDNGQHLLVGAYSETLALMRQIGVNPDTVLRRQPMHIHVPGVFDLRLPRMPAPLHAAFGFLRARGISHAEKWSAIRAMRKLQATDYRLADDMPLSDWLDRNRQRGILRRHLWESLCLAALNTPPEQASAQIFANVLRDTLGGKRAATDFLLPSGTLDEVLPEPALRWLVAHGADLRLGARVHRISAHDEFGAPRWRLNVGHATQDSEMAGLNNTRTEAPDSGLTFASVVLATAPQHIEALLPVSPHLDGLRRTVAAFDYQPIATAYCRYPAGTRLAQRILALPGPLAQWVVDRGELARHGCPSDSRDATDSGLIAHVLSARGRWQDLSKDELVTQLHAELAAVQPGLPAPLRHHVIREHRATFACTPKLARPGNATAFRGLWLAGDYTASDYPATLEAAVRSGAAAARGVLTEANTRP